MDNSNGCFLSNMDFPFVFLPLVVGIFTLIILRVICIAYRSSKPIYTRSPGSLSTLIVLGSGGHTAEMLNLLAVLQKERFKPRYYVAAATDNMSLQKARVLEDSLVDEARCYFDYCRSRTSSLRFYDAKLFIRKLCDSGLILTGMSCCIVHGDYMLIHVLSYIDYLLATVHDVIYGYPSLQLRNVKFAFNSVYAQAGVDVVGTAHFMQIYRSREVGQSYITSIGTTLIATAHALWLMVKIRPQVILCNGPGTCIPLCAISFVFKVFGIRWSSIFYVESIARVKRLSLSGLLLYKLHMADQLFVQWPQLKSKYPQTDYVGRLM